MDNVKFGNAWTIPQNAEKIKDERIKSGKYVKENGIKKWRWNYESGCWISIVGEIF